MLDNICQRHITLMGKTLDILRNLVQSITQEAATTYRDGGDGWTVLEVLGHLRDFDGFFYGRAVMMLEQDNPDLPAYDHEALAIERNYNGQNLEQVFAELETSRERFITFFSELDEAGWERTGTHTENGAWSMMASLLQVGMHDVTHIEQITRILAEKKTG